MFNAPSAARQAISQRFRLISLACSLALLASACGPTAPGSTATPTTVMGSSAELQPATQPSGQSADMPTPASEETATPDSMVYVGSTEYHDVDPCALATDGQVEEVLGQAVTSQTPGAEEDSISGGTLYFCTYLGSGLAVVISYVDAGTAEAAKQALDEELALMKADDPNAAATSQAGMGDQAFWTVTEHAAGYVVRKEGRVLGVALGGSIGDPAAYQAALKTLAESIAAGM